MKLKNIKGLNHITIIEILLDIIILLMIISLSSIPSPSSVSFQLNENTNTSLIWIQAIPDSPIDCPTPWKLVAINVSNNDVYYGCSNISMSYTTN